MKARRLDPARAAVYWQKAQRFADAARAAHHAAQWDPAVSAAIHAGINAFDALCVRHLGMRPGGDAHDEAVDLLADIRQVPDDDQKSIGKRLRALLAAKNLAEYEDRLCDEKDATSAIRQMERLIDRVRRWMAETGGQQ